MKSKMQALSTEDAHKVILATILCMDPDVVVLDEFFVEFGYGNQDIPHRCPEEAGK
jgi:hypothetical protein